MTAMTKEISDALKSAGAKGDLAKGTAVAVAEISASQREFHQGVSDQVRDVQSNFVTLSTNLKAASTQFTADLHTTAAGLRTFVLTRLLLVALGQATITAALVKLIQ